MSKRPQSMYSSMDYAGGPAGLTRVELPAPQARGWDQFWGTLSEELDDEPEGDTDSSHA